MGVGVGYYGDILWPWVLAPLETPIPSEGQDMDLVPPRVVEICDYSPEAFKRRPQASEGRGNLNGKTPQEILFGMRVEPTSAHLDSDSRLVSTRTFTQRSASTSSFAWLISYNSHTFMSSHTKPSIPRNSPHRHPG